MENCKQWRSLAVINIKASRTLKQLSNLESQKDQSAITISRRMPQLLPSTVSVMLSPRLEEEITLSIYILIF